ncbi:MAG: hypothetical protein H6813_04290 [Phycisphaeraceae bacterium]|nr:hypothetical protein [Phycisphaeraceae bacterium]MCB9847167.1 hypothetical protein [Phycisphaeraceae bacterium]
MIRTGLFIPIAAASLVASALAAQDTATPDAAAPAEPGRRVLIDRDLNTREITLLSITEQDIAYLDEQGRTRRASVGGLVALLPLDRPWDAPQQGATSTGDPAAETPPSTGLLELNDGQRLPGEHAPTGGDKDAIIWAHPVFGRVAINLDRVARAVLREPAQTPLDEITRVSQPTSTNRDQLVLANGDRLEGFVVSLGDPVEIDIDGQIVAIAADRVASVRLANPNVPMQGLVVWLDDGSVVVVAAIDSRDGGAVELELPTGQTGVFPASALDAVAFSAGRLIGLAAIEPAAQRPLGDRHTAEPTRILNDPIYESSGRLNAPDIQFPGPMLASWQLPPGARRFATIAEMPFDAIPWGDCVLTVQVDSTEQARQRINADNPRFEINIPIDPNARTLTISIEPGAWGPINDRITLRRPLLLLDNDQS